ncbi:hypothetical protein [Sphingosinithalassobacter portus]|uniref:hypothetical protein n=1 Tax=Stakelama portus TaxID=2676234 RepID=UPI000D6E5D73|nr:hypothetical protein [Sphingosinithalassobacter portus]
MAAAAMTSVLPLLSAFPAQAGARTISVSICGMNGTIGTIQIPIRGKGERRSDCAGGCHAACMRCAWEDSDEDDPEDR